MLDRRLRVIRRGAGGAVEDQEVIALLDATTIRVRLAGEPGWGVELAAEALIDLLARVFPRIEVVVDPAIESDARLPPGPTRLAERLQQARAHGVEPREPGAPAVTVHVGPGAEAADLYVDGHGWQAYLGRQPSQLPRDVADELPFGPLAAAARGAAHAFQLATQELIPAPDPPVSIYWSGLDYSSAAAPLTIASAAAGCRLEAVLAGAGSIGGAAVYAFARTPRLSGRLDVADPQALEAGNFDRALLATAERSRREETKASVATAALAHLPGFVAEPHVRDLAAFVAARPREQPLPLTLCAVDSREARRAIQDCLPRELVNAACSPLDSVVSGHLTGAGPCVVCLFMADWMNAEQVRYRLIARATRLPEETVLAWMTQNHQLGVHELREIAGRRGLDRGAFDDYAGVTLAELWRRELVYGGVEVTTASGAVVVVAAPWVTALAGFLLAGEAYKRGDAGLGAFRLGPYAGAPGLHYRESVYGSPALAQLTNPARWPDHACLCNSPRRRRLIVERYGLAEDEYRI